MAQDTPARFYRIPYGYCRPSRTSPETQTANLGMLRFAVDEDFDNRIVRGLLRLLPTLDIVRAQDAGLLGKLDPEILEWASGEKESPPDA